ncbi:hypothetical protein [Nitrosopumilus sp. S6]
MSRTDNKSSSTQRSKYESLIVASVLLAILLPVRIFFSVYVSDDWFSSFGLISVISIVMLVLVKKNKLGKFGEMFQNTMLKIQSGKKGILVYSYVLFMILFLSMMIFAINQGNSEFLHLKEQLISNLTESEFKNNISNPIEIIDWVGGIFSFFEQMISGSPHMYALMAMINDVFEGWLLHFYTVGLVESLEIFGILIFYRVLVPRKKISK